MNRGLMGRGLLILAVTVIAIIGFVPPKEKIKLGLDLRGGMYLELQVQTADALRSETDKDMERLRLELADEKVASVTTRRLTDTEFEAVGVPVDSDELVTKVVDEFLPSWEWRGTNDVLRFAMTELNVTAIRNQAVQQAEQTISNRVDEFGVAEHVVQRKGTTDRIVIQLPGVSDPERVKRLIKNTAFLEFRLVDFPRTGGSAASEAEVLASYGGTLPENVEIMSGPERDKQGRTIGQRYYGIEKRRVITGRDLKNARPGLGQFNEPIVNFTLTAEGGRLFGDATGANIDRGLAIILDGKVVSAPKINARITDSGLIEGGFTQKEVEDLSAVLRSGALPAGIVYLEERTVGPSLGADSIRQGLIAGLVGALLTVLTMFVIYKFTGFNAVAALLLNVILILGGLAYFGATLTLPGIAGIILTFGMAFDANVLVFERIREELRLGRTVRTSIDAGFTKAMSSILDANICTLIAALFLFQFGTGPVRGFAVTLSIGVLSTLFAGVFFSRWLFDAMLQRRQGADTLSI